MFHSIAALRALAAFWVLAAHCMIWGGWYGVPLPSPKYAVDLFMMISGFLMVAQADARGTAEPLSQGRNRLRFWLRRYFRLAPAYYLALGLAVVTAPYFLAGYQALQDLNPSAWEHEAVYRPASIEYSLSNVLLHLSFVFGMLPQWSATTMLPDWSLGLEMQFYAVFPFLLLAFDRWKVKALIAAVAVSLLLAWLARRHLVITEQSLLVLKLHQFLAGMLICRAKTWRMVAVAMLFAALDRRLAPPLRARAMAVMVHRESLGLLPAWLRGRWIHFASEMSYAVYLFHGFLISAFGLAIAHSTLLKQWSPPVRVAAMFGFVTVGSYAFAWVVYRWIELPGIEWGRQLSQRLLATATGTPGSPAGDR